MPVLFSMKDVAHDLMYKRMVAQYVLFILTLEMPQQHLLRVFHRFEGFNYDITPVVFIQWYPPHSSTVQWYPIIDPDSETL